MHTHTHIHTLQNTNYHIEGTEASERDKSWTSCFEISGREHANYYPSQLKAWQESDCWWGSWHGCVLLGTLIKNACKLQLEETFTSYIFSWIKKMQPRTKPGNPTCYLLGGLSKGFACSKQDLPVCIWRLFRIYTPLRFSLVCASQAHVNKEEPGPPHQVFKSGATNLWWCKWPFAFWSVGSQRNWVMMTQYK